MGKRYYNKQTHHDVYSHSARFPADPKPTRARVRLHHAFSRAFSAHNRSHPPALCTKIATKTPRSTYTYMQKYTKPIKSKASYTSYLLGRITCKATKRDKNQGGTDRHTSVVGKHARMQKDTKQKLPYVKYINTSRKKTSPYVPLPLPPLRCRPQPPRRAASISQSARLSSSLTFITHSHSCDFLQNNIVPPV